MVHISITFEKVVEILYCGNLIFNFFEVTSIHLYLILFEIDFIVRFLHFFTKKVKFQFINIFIHVYIYYY